ncbi:MAG TPA: S9 family peptidase [Candidatus Eisenbacteria bacterium]|nr:S9 family peptidase [Candidatus Eisenbacteria bacterium]
MNEPVCPKIPHESTVHGHLLRDDYRWLRERSSEAVLGHLRAENAYTAAVMAPTEPLQKRLYDEMLSRIQETDLSVPVRIDDFFYYSRTEKGRQYPIWCRRRGSEEAPEEVLLDGNSLAEGRPYFRVGAFRVSSDHRLLAYSADTDGSESYTLRVKDLATGELLADELRGLSGGVEWSADDRILFYSTLNASRRPFRLWRHRLGDAQAADTLVFEEPDESYFLSVHKTKDRRYLVLGLHSQVTSEIRFLAASDPEGSFRLVEPRRTGVEYALEHHDGRFFVLTNDAGRNFRLAVVSAAEPARANWKDVIPHRDHVLLEGLEVFRDHLVVYEREDGLPHLEVRGLKPGARPPHRIPFDEAVYTVWRGANPDFESRRLRFGYTSLVTPQSIYDYDLETGERVLKKRTPVLGGYDPSEYDSARVFAVSHDGTGVPVSLVWKKDRRRDPSPTLLCGYGSYGISYDPEFSSTRLSLLNRGVVYAIAHVRGGSDLGRAWYEDGKLLKKKNTFLDFVAAAEDLVRRGFTKPELLAIEGGSAGGMLMGAVTNLRPSLFRAVIAKVPFVDVLQTMLDKSLPLTVIEEEEWGDPVDPAYFDYIRSYSPCDNVVPAAYPEMLITGGLNDPRVQYWEPAKWAAKLRENRKGKSRVLLKMNMDAGHGGASGRYDALKELAFEYAFILDSLGIPS